MNQQTTYTEILQIEGFNEYKFDNDNSKPDKECFLQVWSKLMACLGGNLGVSHQPANRASEQQLAIVIRFSN